MVSCTMVKEKEVLRKKDTLNVALLANTEQWKVKT